MIIREETPEDIEAIHQLTQDAFGQVDEAFLVDALRDSEDIVLSLVAEDMGIIIGHVLLSRLQAPKKSLALAPLSVAPDHQKQGIGAKLIEECFARAKRARWHSVFVLGDPAYYERFGFTTWMAGKFETDYPKQYFMAMELKPEALEKRSGKVIYAEPFLAL